MQCFNENERRKTHSNECGSVGCAIGHGPYAGIEKTERDWLEYSERVFGIDRRAVEWDYVFDDKWSAYDNTPQGAARRLQEVLDGKTEFEFPWE